MRAVPSLKPRLQRACALALVVVVLLAQALALAHRSVHGSGGSALRFATWAHGEQGEHHAEGWTADLFGSHSDASDCRLFDALGQPGCTPAAVIAPVSALPVAVLAGNHAEFVARRAALFDARGPPVSR